MGREEHIKMVLKVVKIDTERVEWVHFCYVKKDLYNKFVSEKNVRSTDFNEIIARWVKEDFNVDLSMTSSTDVILLKGLLRDFYKRAHPEFYVEHDNDQQGWTRTWVTRKMMEELNLYARK